MNPWSLTYEGFDPEKEKLREALCALGNGYFVTRGACAQAKADDVHYPGTYLAGGYNRLDTEIAGRVIENEDLVNMPNWLPLDFRIEGGSWFRPAEADLVSYSQALDLKRGILTRDILFRDHGDRRTRVRERRLVHMSQSHLAAIEMTFEPENWSGKIEIRSALDGRVINDGVERYRQLNSKHLVPLCTGLMGDSGMFLKVRTSQSEVYVALAARTETYVNGRRIFPETGDHEEEGYVARQYTVESEKGTEVRVEKVIALYTSRDHAVTECGIESKKDMEKAGPFDRLLESHSLAWSHLWRRFEVSFRKSAQEDDHRMEMILRLYIFHLLQSVSMHTMDLDVGVPSRGWHGEAYRGHIFWDELFIFPFLNLRVPEITRSLLMYRYRRLGEARKAARIEGYGGAMYPWQSGSNGREESQEVHLNPESGRWIPDNSHLQRHVNAAIVYNVSKYYEVTGDMEFLSFYGAEMVMEIARFWAGISSYNSDLGRYEIIGVMGPDEYHEGYPGREEEGLKNNAYTNVMAVWVLGEALRILDILPDDRAQELRETIQLEDEEIEHWRNSTGRDTAKNTGTSSDWTGYSRRKTKRRTGTRHPSRPMCLCFSISSHRRSSAVYSTGSDTLLNMKPSPKMSITIWTAPPTDPP
jgi:alpha,alpha-trehalase